MDKIFHSKAIIWACLIIGLIAIIAIIVAAAAKHSSQNSQPVATEKPQLPPPPEFNKQLVTEQALPPNFPTDFPVEKGAKITQNYTGTTTDGVKQSTRVYETSKNLQDNFNLFETYLKKNGWTIGADSQDPQLMAIAASKGQLQATISLSDNTVTHIKTVSVSIVQRTK